MLRSVIIIWKIVWDKIQSIGGENFFCVCKAFSLASNYANEMLCGLV